MLKYWHRRISNVKTTQFQTWTPYLVLLFFFFLFSFPFFFPVFLFLLMSFTITTQTMISKKYSFLRMLKAGVHRRSNVNNHTDRFWKYRNPCPYTGFHLRAHMPSNEFNDNYQSFALPSTCPDVHLLNHNFIPKV